MTHLTPTELLAKLRADYEVTGYSGTKRMQSEMKAAFDLVAPTPNWKFPIDAVLPLAGTNIALLVDAVVHFTGAVPTFTAQGTTLRVTAPGYYRTIGA